MRKPCIYEIRVEDHLAERWSEWFAGLKLTQTESGDTVLSGPVVDQAAVYVPQKGISSLDDIPAIEASESWSTPFVVGGLP